MPPKLLKFDIIHPTEYLEKKKAEWDDLHQLSAAEYRHRLINLRSNYSDFYTYHLRNHGWQAEEFFLLDQTYLDKLGRELFGLKYPLEKVNSKFWHKVRPARWGWAHRVIQAYIEQFDPDVLFARSQPMASRYWQQYRDRCLLVSRLSARLPRNWHPDDWDLIYTDLDQFKAFFEAHNVPTYINRQGFDPRILDELEDREPLHDVVFVGGMGTQNFSRRTRFFEELAGRVDFKWWGYWWKFGGWGSLDDFPNLKKSFQGPVSGLEMYQLYKDSKIIMNDYVDTSENIGFNQRMFEVMGSGSFMLTRQAGNFKDHFPDTIFETFRNVDECVAKISHYLDHPDDRSATAAAGQQFVLDNYNYTDIVEAFDRELREALNKKGITL